METPVNLVLEIRNQEELGLVKQFIEDTINTLPVEYNDLLNRIQYRRVNSHKEARVRISNQVIAVGTLEEMESRYRTECGMNSTSDIVLEHWLNGEFRPIRVRRYQSL